MKKYLLFLLMLIMSFSISRPVMAQPVGDITPPVILDVEFLNNGHVAANDRYVYFKVTGYDSDGGTFDPSETVVDYHVPDFMSTQETDGRFAESVTDHGDGTYTFKFPVSERWHGAYTVVGLVIGDDSGNRVRIDVMDPDTGRFYYKGVIDRNVTAITASNIAIDGSASDYYVTLTDTVLRVPYTFSADITVPQGTTLRGGQQMSVVYKTTDGHVIEFGVDYDQNQGKIEGIPDIMYGMDAGTYIMDGIYYNDSNYLTINGTAPKIVVSKNNTDRTAPVVNDIWLEVNGAKANGAAVRKGAGSTDKVEVFVKVTDSSAIDRVKLNLQTAHPSYENPITLRLDPVAGMADTYSAEVPLNEYGATVWFVDDCYAYDIYQNMEPELDFRPYFILQDEGSNTSIPTVEFQGIEIETGPDGQIIRYDHPITLEAVTSLEEILTVLGTGLGTVNIPAGLNFEGWYIGTTGKTVAGTTPEAAAKEPIVLSKGNDNYLIIAPKYDKLAVYLGCNYWASGTDGDMIWKEDRELVYLNPGSTVQDALNAIDLTQIQHHPEFVFDHYVCDGYDNLWQELNPCNAAVWYSAVYSSIMIRGSYDYYNKDGEHVMDEFKLNISPTKTHQDALDAVYNHLLGLNLEHDSEKGNFLGWEAVPGWYMDELNNDAEPGCYYEYTAKYDKKIVGVSAKYIDANDELCHEFIGEVTISGNSTYQDVLNSVASALGNISHSSRYSFTNWTIDCMSLTDTVSDEEVEIQAQYGSFPVTILYTYQGVNGLTTERLSLDVPSGTDMEVVFNQQINPPHDGSLMLNGWRFFLDGAQERYPAVDSLTYHAAAAYVNQEPSWVITAYVDKGDNHVSKPIVCYTPAVPRYNADNTVIDRWVDDVKIAAQSLIQAECKYNFTDFEELGYNINERTVFSNYSTAPSVMLLPQTVETEVNFVFPDGSSQMQVMNANSQYTLPAQYNGADIKWIFDHPFGIMEYAGGDTIDLPVPYVDLQAEYVSGSGQNSSQGSGGNSSQGGNTSQGGNSGSSSSQTTTPPVVTPTVTPVPAPAVTPGTTVPAVPSVTPGAAAPSVSPSAPPAAAPGNTTTPVPATAPAPVELDTAAETNAIADIQQAANGTVVKVNMMNADGNMATVVTKEMLQAAQGKAVTIELDMGGYSWTIYGEDIKALDDIHDVNLEVILDTNAIPSRTVQTLAAGKPARQLSLTYNGDFGFKADLTINVGKQYAGSTGSLYYYDSMGKLVFIDSSTIDTNGDATLSFSHASDYVVIFDQEMAEEQKGEDSEESAAGEDDEDNNLLTEHTEKRMALWPVWLVIAAAAAAMIAAVVVVIKTRKK